MLRTVPYHFLLLLLLAAPLLGAGQGFLRREGKIIRNDKGAVILRGVGLGGWMLQEPYMLQLSGAAINQSDIRSKIAALGGKDVADAFYKDWLKNFITKKDIDAVAAWGFNSVRLPMHYNLYTLPVQHEPVPGRQTWIEEGFAWTDSLLSWCKANKLYLVLDLHAAPGGQGSDIPISDRDTSLPSLWQSAAAKEKTVALWRKLAQRYAAESWIGAYDIINEPNWGFSDPKDKNGCSETGNAPLRALLGDITRAIREVDKQHMIFIEGNCWGNNYKGILPVEDENTALSFHKYWNHNDRASIQGYLDLRDQYNMPIWLGESGENSNAWFRDAIALVEEHGIGWNWWPLKKMGINNPLEIYAPRSYTRLADYWKGTGSKPSPAEVKVALNEVIAAIRFENNKVHHDVLDALFRQVRDASTVPFKPHPLEHTLYLDAAHYDMGRNGLAYFDLDSGNYWVSTGKRTQWNRGGKFRNDGVDIMEVPGDKYRPAGYAVGHFETGEWMQYTIDVETPRMYTIMIRYGADSAAAVALSVNDKRLPPVQLAPAKHTARSGGVLLAELPLQKGRNVLRLHAVTGPLSVQQLVFRPAQKKKNNRSKQ